LIENRDNISDYVRKMIVLPIGMTDIVQPIPGTNIYVLDESQNFSGSVKARPSEAMILGALYEGRIKSDTCLIEATSGNTGIAFASIAKELGIKMAVVIDKKVTLTRKQLLEEKCGLVIYINCDEEGPDGPQIYLDSLFQGKLRDDLKSIFFGDNSLINNSTNLIHLNQYANIYNPFSHYLTTGHEIQQFIVKMELPLPFYFISGVGTSGTFIGAGKRLKEEFGDKLIVLEVQPDSAMHGLYGLKHMGSAIKPLIYDEWFRNLHKEAPSDISKFASSYSLPYGPSGYANIWAAQEIMKQNPKSAVITLAPDSSKRYEK
jgi:cysteine synthase B